METIKKEDLVDHLKKRVSALEYFIAEQYKKIDALKLDETEKLGTHLESIGKIRARKEECEALILTVNKLSLGIDTTPSDSQESGYSIKLK